ncbi:hypothetical protein JYU18_00190 [bacterium AH-315-E07]|nr:hypothetical protein [bacterium AH-315-E07]
MRVICILLMAGFVASANVPFLFVSLFVLMLVYFSASLSVGECWALMRRMRWFFLSILVIYFWFTPGRAFSPALSNALWFPSVDGVKLGLIRVACLVLIIAAVSALLQSTRREQLFAAIYSLVAWTRYLGLSPERFAVRSTLTLEVMAKVQEMIAVKKSGIEPAATVKARIASLANATSGVFVDVYKNAQQAELTPVTLNQAEPLKLWQWLYPFSLLLSYILILKFTEIY